MAIWTRLTDVIAEQSSARISGVLQDEDGNGIPSGQLTSLILTLYVEGEPSSIINNRNTQDVLNANGVTVDELGNLSWQMSPADNEIVDSGGTSPESEYHVALFEWAWGGGAKKGRHKIIVQVANFDHVS